MSQSWSGDSGKSKPNLKLDGKKVIVETVSVYDGSIPISYIREVIHHFATEDAAMEYYYKKR